MFLVDTNLLSELRRQDRAAPSVLAWARGIDAADMFVSVISILELEVGILSVSRRDRTQGDILRRWIENQVIPGFGDRILPVDLAVVRRCAGLHVPDRRPERDGLIGATTLVHGLTVATRNVQDFEPMGVSVINPWDN
jgi:toxin FitB